MTKIYISYQRSDKEIARQIADGLRALGHQVFIDIDALSVGQNWRAALSDSLRNSDVVVSLLSEASAKSQYVFSELGAARAYAETTGATLLIPVLLDEIPVPSPIADRQAIVAPDRNVSAIVEQIEQAITAFLAQKAAKEKEASERKQQVETNAAVYIEDALQWLGKNGRRDRRNGTIWSTVGFITLALGVIFGYRSISQAISAQQFEWVRFAYVALKSVIVIGLLLACSKYAFTLGKTYMAESLKSADRVHAISFGKFYLRAYGDKAQWTELKEVFQHWNLDRISAFSGLDAAQFDPKFVDALTEIAKATAAVKGSK